MKQYLVKGKMALSVAAGAAMTVFINDLVPKHLRDQRMKRS